jgi:hypothetical protein
MKKIIAGIKNYRKDLKTQSDFWLLIIGYSWIFSICLIIGLILAFLFHASKDAEAIIRFGAFFIIGMLLNFVILTIVRLFAGKGHEDSAEEPKSFEERLQELQKEAKAREELIKFVNKLPPVDKP